MPGNERDASAIAEIWCLGWRDGHLGFVPDELVEVRTERLSADDVVYAIQDENEGCSARSECRRDSQLPSVPAVRPIIRSLEQGEDWCWCY